VVKKNTNKGKFFQITQGTQCNEYTIPVILPVRLFFAAAKPKYPLLRPFKLKDIPYITKNKI